MGEYTEIKMTILYYFINCFLIYVNFAYEKLNVNFVKEDVNKIPSTGFQLSSQQYSVQQCIQMCAFNSNCQVAYYRVADSRCAMYETPMFTFSASVIDPGFDVYRSWNECESSGYLYYRDGKICVRLYYTSTRITRENADDNCATSNASLMSVDTVQKRDFLYRFLVESYTGNFNLLVGLKSEGSVWRWRNGAVFQESLYPVRQLNHYDSDMVNCNAGHCVVFALDNTNQSNQFRIWDNCCLRIEHSYICEKTTV